MQFGPTNPMIDLGHVNVSVHPVVTNLGVKIDSDFKFNKQINAVVKSSFYHLRLLAKVKPFLSFSSFE